jgi:hypothetical protein
MVSATSSTNGAKKLKSGSGTIIIKNNNPGTRRLELMVVVTKSPSRKFIPHLMVTNHMIVLHATYHLSTVSGHQSCFHYTCYS